jgi:DNA adenine methylase
VVNFFACLRDEGEELVRLISLTPFSRAELVKALAPASGLSSLERARRFFVRARQTRTGLAQTSSEGRWAHCVLTSRANMAGAVSRWLGSVEGLPEIVQRLQRVQIENAPALEIILRYDSPETLFYCDPPYPHQARGDARAYGYEMTDREHEKLAETLGAVRGAVALSGYRCTLMDRLYSEWRRVDAGTRLCNSSKGERTESLWANYDPAKPPLPDDGLPE